MLVGLVLHTRTDISRRHALLPRFVNWILKWGLCCLQILVTEILCPSAFDRANLGLCVCSILPENCDNAEGVTQLETSSLSSQSL